MAALLFLTLVLISGTSSSAYQGEVRTTSPTTIDRYPSAVQVDFLGVFSGLWSQSCAGSVLNSHYILSAAHCFSGLFYRPENRRIRAGTTFRNTGGLLAYVEVEYNHPAFAVVGYDSDVTVVRLATQLTYSPVVQQAHIIYQDAVIPDGLAIIHTGWGTTRKSEYPSDSLLETTMYKFSNYLCDVAYSIVPGAVPVTENMICSVPLTYEDDDLCQGDFGGPLFFSNTVIGIKSWGFGCSNATYPIVSTNVGSFSDWIVDTAV